MSENIITIERLKSVLEEFNSKYPRPVIGKLELSECVKVDDKSVSWPNCTKPGVYVLFKGETEVVYIGKASCNTNLGFRLGAHFYTDGEPKHDWLKDVTHVRTVPVETAHAFEAPAIEEYLIQRLNPPLNVTGRRTHEV